MNTSVPCKGSSVLCRGNCLCFNTPLWHNGIICGSPCNVVQSLVPWLWVVRIEFDTDVRTQTTIPCRVNMVPPFSCVIVTRVIIGLLVSPILWSDPFLLPSAAPGGLRLAWRTGIPRSQEGKQIQPFARHSNLLTSHLIGWKWLSLPLMLLCPTRFGSQGGLSGFWVVSKPATCSSWRRKRCWLKNESNVRHPATMT